jgi:hypothetical protein
VRRGGGGKERGQALGEGVDEGGGGFVVAPGVRFLAAKDDHLAKIVVVLGDFIGGRVQGWLGYPHDDGIVFPAFWSDG